MAQGFLDDFLPREYSGRGFLKDSLGEGEGRRGGRAQPSARRLFPPKTPSALGFLYDFFFQNSLARSFLDDSFRRPGPRPDDFCGEIIENASGRQLFGRKNYWAEGCARPPLLPSLPFPPGPAEIILGGFFPQAMEGPGGRVGRGGRAQPSAR